MHSQPHQLLFKMCINTNEAASVNCEEIMKVDIIEHNSENKSVEAVFTTQHIPALILAEYLADSIPFEYVV